MKEIFLYREKVGIEIPDYRYAMAVIEKGLSLGLLLLRSKQQNIRIIAPVNRQN